MRVLRPAMYSTRVHRMLDRFGIQGFDGILCLAVIVMLGALVGMLIADPQLRKSVIDALEAWK